MVKRLVALAYALLYAIRLFSKESTANIFQIGIKPRDELGPGAGIQRAGRGGFAIDERYFAHGAAPSAHANFLGYKHQYLVFTPSENVPVGITKHSASSRPVSKWPTF